MSPKPREALQSQSIPAFGLYGEAPGAAGFGAFHVEPLSVRLSPGRGRIHAHRHEGLRQLFVLAAGRCDGSIDARRFVLTGPAAFTVPASAPHAFTFADTADGHVVTLRADPPSAIAPDAAGRLSHWLFDGPRRLDLSSDAEAAPRIRMLCEALMSAQGASDGPAGLASDLLLGALLAVLAASPDIAGTSPSAKETADTPTSRFRRFEEMVARHAFAHWPVARYARTLGMSESALNRLCRAHAGRSAFQFLQDRLSLEARRRLAYSAAPVAQIGADLGFADPAYFSRFIRRRTGLSPLGFRRAVRASPPQG